MSEMTVKEQCKCQQGCSKEDRLILRDLAARYMELCESKRNKRSIEEWRRLNNMQPCRPMIRLIILRPLATGA